MTLPPEFRAVLTRNLALAGDAHSALLTVPCLATNSDRDAVSMARKTLASIALDIQKILAEDARENKEKAPLERGHIA